MSIVLSVYVSSAFYQYLLPAIDNSDYQISLKKHLFNLSKDLNLELEVINREWSIKNTPHYYVYKKTNSNESRISNGEIISIRTNEGATLSVIVRETGNVFRSTLKFVISNLPVINIGDGPHNNIQYQYSSLVSKNHAQIQRTANGYVIVDSSSNGTFVNGKRINVNYTLVFGDEINIFGLKIIFLGNIIAVLSFADYYVQGLSLYQEKPEEREERSIAMSVKQFFHRSPRNNIKLENENIEIDPPPTQKEGDNKPLWMVIGPSFTMVIPMMAGSVLMLYSSRMSGNTSGLYMYTGIVTAFGAATIGVFWALKNVQYNKKVLKQQEELRFSKYRDYLFQKTNEIKTKYENYRDAMNAMYPSIDRVLRFSENSPELWNRNIKHEDFLCQRIGTGDLDFPMVINVPKERFSIIDDELSEKPQQIKSDFSTLYSVPIVVDIFSHRLIGIVGGKEKRGAFEVLKVLSAQIAANNCYTDVKLVYIVNSHEECEDWEYTKWFPHVWSEDKKIRFVATNKTEASDIFYELTQLFRFRAEESEDKKSIPKPYYVIVVSDMQLLEGELITKYMYNNLPEYGFTTIVLSESVDMLPNECEYVLENDRNFIGIHDLSTDNLQRVKFDNVDNVRLEMFARKLMPIEVREVEIGRDIPDAISFFEMYNVKRLEQFNIEDRWRKNRNYENMRALIGLKGGGQPCYLDVHEKYHGPHGLVAGTTGSGKSETLQTYLLSLAINFSPDDIGFFIIDYKGGGMAGLFDGLPHMVGSISNLSGNQVRRAMVSIKSENKRRQRLFNENNVNNINLYTKLYKNGGAKEAIPHLFIVIDEFAELKREEPEFMKELISVAQVGRSLGVHLILATQKPSGTVDDNIWSNSKFRLCLRVQDQQDSKDMLHKPDAAFITQAGRGYLQVGNDEIYELFQSGYSGAPYDPDMLNAQEDIASIINITGVDTYVGTKKRSARDTGKNVTQLDAVIAYINEVAQREGYNKQMQLWMPLLPNVMYLSQLSGYSAYNGEWEDLPGKFSLSTVIGLCDDPVNQAQMPLTIDFAEGGHLAVCGLIACGKSTFVQSLLYALIGKYSPEKLNIYALDFSTQMLGCYENAPHCGGVMFENELEKVSKFFFMLDSVIEERKRLFRGGNYSQYVQVNGYKLPAIIIVIDNYSSFREKTGMIYDDKMLRIAKEGVGYGIYLILTAGGFSSSEIPMKLGDNIKTVVTLSLNDKFAYMEALRVNKVSVLPESNTPGRGLALVSEIPLEFQTALPFPADDDFARSEAIKNLCASMRQSWKGATAKPIPSIPENPVWSQFEQLDDYKKLNGSYSFLPIGYDMVSAEVYGIDLSKTYSYLVSGRARTGKTTVLKSIIRAASGKGAKVVVIEHEASELEITASKAGAKYINNVEKQADFFTNLVPTFKERNVKKNAMKNAEKDEADIFEGIQEFEQMYIVVSDIASFVKSIYQKNDNIVSTYPFIENIAEKGKLHNIYFIFGINPDTVSEVFARKAYVAFTGYRTGIHLGGNISSLKYFDYNNFDFKEQSRMFKPGIGMLAAGNDDRTKYVVLPNVKG